MKGTKYLIAGLMVSASVTLCFGQELTKGEKDTILIGPVQIAESVTTMAVKNANEVQLKNLAESLEVQLTSALSMTGVFQIVERKRKGDIELEQAFAAVAVNPNDKNAAKVLQMTGAKFILLTRIDGFEDISETQKFEALDKQTQTHKFFLSATAQIVDTTTGALLPDVASVQLDKIVEGDMMRAGTTLSSERALVELAKEMATKLSQKSLSSMKPAKVLDITGKEVFINRGSESGFNVGDLVEFYATEDVKDPDAGVILKKEVPVGQAIVNRVADRSSYATANGDNLGIVKGCIVRVIKSAELTKPDDKPLTPGSSDKPLKWN